MRTGLTGLAFVFLLVLSAAAFFGGTGAPLTEPRAEDPLAALGIVPGGEAAQANPEAPERSIPRAEAPPVAPEQFEPLPGLDEPLLDSIPRPAPDAPTDGDLVEI
ncbi:MAG: hypothetical protein V2J26_04225 [Pacificimonas sp.]|nr:hypothetical protein [Pacificimonas sp.]